jgi:hypothetical protein
VFGLCVDQVLCQYVRILPTALGVFLSLVRILLRHETLQQGLERILYAGIPGGAHRKGGMIVCL